MVPSTACVYPLGVRRWLLPSLTACVVSGMAGSVFTQGCGTVCQQGSESCPCVLGSSCELGLSCIGGLCVTEDEYDPFTTDEGTSDTGSMESGESSGLEPTTTTGVPEPLPDGDPYGDPAVACPDGWFSINILGGAGEPEGQVCTRECSFSSQCRQDAKVPDPARCFFDESQTSGLCILECSFDSECALQDDAMFCTEPGICAYPT